ncbi:MAG: DNA replication and repair protein RecF [Flavobacteriaceae bacterium]|jgi:DNA replication and repair protein RecF|nr:DNA replication and repair protein RecF [Flavobacteriaceae bacterium]CAI8361921.1 MAG: DNA replication and repair protein RecF [Flavobacteriaceae bacterium]|tara:strand:+ start:653 stop:1732 length:1080 start_codon:yes stop_codon:yes gene_type:complete
MILKSITLTNYKSFSSKTIKLDNNINCFIGPNGVGKSNILDAIYHLSFGKSYFNPISSQNIKHGEDFFAIKGSYLKNEKEETIIINFKKNDKKVIKRNNKKYEKFSDHIGLLPLVIISPSDRNLIAEGSEIRRRFLDSVISQSDKSYLDNIINYNKVLSQRNSLLKLFYKNKNIDINTIEVYDSQLEVIGESIFEKRKLFLKDFVPVFKDKYKSISNDNEEVDITYRTDLESEKLSILLKNSLEKDMFLQYTSKGIHKDDLIFNINNYSVKKFGSQGQQKSLLIALKLAQFDFLKNQTNNNPILLLDDIFDKLDKNRVKQIINLVSANDFGQIFISDTDEERTKESIKEITNSNSIFNL